MNANDTTKIRKVQRLGSIAVAMGDVGAACNGCHDDIRAEEK